MVFCIIGKPEGPLFHGPSKGRKASWSPPSEGVLKFNVDGAARVKPGTAGLGGVLHNIKGVVFVTYSKHVDIFGI